MSYTLIQDDWSDFDLSTGRFTCPATGTYEFNFFGSLDTQLASTTERFTTYIADAAFTAGQIELNGSTSNSGGATGALVISSGGGGPVKLTKGQIRSLWVMHENAAGATRILEGGFPDTTKIMIRRVG